MKIMQSDGTVEMTQAEYIIVLGQQDDARKRVRMKGLAYSTMYGSNRDAKVFIPLSCIPLMRLEFDGETVIGPKSKSKDQFSV